MIITQNLVFNLPICVVMTLVASLKSGAGINVGTIIQYFIGLAVIEILGAVVPVQKIAMVFLPLSMKVSGMDKLGQPPQE